MDKGRKIASGPHEAQQCRIKSKCAVVSSEQDAECSAKQAGAATMACMIEDNCQEEDINATIKDSDLLQLFNMQQISRRRQKRMITYIQS